MDRRQTVLLGLLAVLVVGLYLVGVGVGSGGGPAGDPHDAGGVEALEGALTKLPGVGRTLDADDIEADCFVDGVFRLDDEHPSCRVEIPDNVDRLVLRPRDPGCRIEVAEQDGIGRQALDIGDADDDGALRIALSGDGVDVEFSIAPFGTADRCVVDVD